MTDANHRVDAVQRQLRDLQGSRNNKLKLFGSWVPELLQRVEQADQRGKFHHRPVGPIGKRNLFWSSYELLMYMCTCTHAGKFSRLLFGYNMDKLFK